MPWYCLFCKAGQEQNVIRMLEERGARPLAPLAVHMRPGQKGLLRGGEDRLHRQEGPLPGLEVRLPVEQDRIRGQVGDHRVLRRGRRRGGRWSCGGRRSGGRRRGGLRGRRLRGAAAEQEQGEEKGEKAFHRQDLWFLSKVCAAGGEGLAARGHGFSVRVMVSMRYSPPFSVTVKTAEAAPRSAV